MARSSVVAALMVMAVFVGLASAQGPFAAPAYAPSKSTIAAAPTTTTPAPIAATPEESTIAAAPTTVAGGPSVSVAPESSTPTDLASPPAPGSEAAEGPVGDFSGPAPAADAPSETPVSAGAALKASAIVGVAAVAGSLIF